MDSNTKSIIPALVLALCVTYLAVCVAQWLSGEPHLGRVIVAVSGIVAASYLCIRLYKLK